MGLLSSPVLSLPLSSFHPSKTTAGHLWRVYVDAVDIFFKVLHVPTTEILVYTVINDPDAASPESLSLCFAIYYAAAVALEDAPDCLQLLGEDWPSALQRYKTGMEQAFARADLLENPTLAMLQGLSSYIVGSSLLQALAEGEGCLAVMLPSFFFFSCFFLALEQVFLTRPQHQPSRLDIKWTGHQNSPVYWFAQRRGKPGAFAFRIRNAS